MPYVLVSTQIRLESGPCMVGDEDSDPNLMKYLGAKLIKQLGNNFLEWRTEETPRAVLNLLEEQGYKVVSMAGIGQTCIWTCHRDDTGGATGAQSPGIMIVRSDEPIALRKYRFSHVATIALPDQFVNKYIQLRNTTSIDF